MPVGPLTALWHRSFVTMLWMKVVVYVTHKVVATMKPGPGPNEYSGIKPLRPVIAIRSAGIWRDVIVPIRTVWRHSNVDTNLSVRRRRSRR
jgi:hypothetical protein